MGWWGKTRSDASDARIPLGRPVPSDCSLGDTRLSPPRSASGSGTTPAGTTIGGRPVAVEEAGPAPDFTLTSDAGEEVTLSALRGKPVVLYFYPKDDTLSRDRQ